MKKINKFMFVVPNTRWFGKRLWMWFVPGVTILTPILIENGIEVKICEANIDDLSFDEVETQIREYSPDMVGISNMSVEYWKQLHEVARITKKVDQSIITVAGGVHPTTLPNKVIEDDNIDYVILSEGEKRLMQFIKLLEKNKKFVEMNGIVFKDENKNIIKISTQDDWYMDLDKNSLPDYNIYENPDKVFNHHERVAGGISTRRTPVASILTSRGCPFKCSFCAAPVTTGRKMRYRSADNVLKEIDYLVNEWGVKEIVFQDDEMYASLKRAREIIQGIKDRNYDLTWKNTNLASWRMKRDLVKLMGESGCYQIVISPESGNERVLNEIIHKPARLDDSRNVVKWAKEAGIEILADFVIGFPGETWDEIRDTTNFAEEIDADAVKFAVATPFPATELYRVAVEKGLFPKNYNFYTDQYLGFANPTMDTEHWSAQDLKMIRVLEWDRINFKNEDKRKRYAKVNEITLEEIEKFRKETRKNLGVYFFGSNTNAAEARGRMKESIKNENKWGKIKAVNANIDSQQNKNVHEVI